MNITRQNTERLTLEQIREFVEEVEPLGFASPKGQAVYEFIERVLKSQQYRRINRGQKGVVCRFPAKMTGLSRACKRAGEEEAQSGDTMTRKRDSYDDKTQFPQDTRRRVLCRRAGIPVQRNYSDRLHRNRRTRPDADEEPGK